MTLTTILWTIALAIFFAISNAVSHQRGIDKGEVIGFQEGVHAAIRKNGDRSYSVTFIGTSQIEKKE